jgi:iron-sulfur cluster insertion protein
MLTSFSCLVPVMMRWAIAQRLKQLQASESDPNLVLRIEVEGGGCSGFHYKFGLENGSQVNEDDM